MRDPKHEFSRHAYLVYTGLVIFAGLCCIWMSLELFISTMVSHGRVLFSSAVIVKAALFVLVLFLLLLLINRTWLLGIYAARGRIGRTLLVIGTAIIAIATAYFTIRYTDYHNLRSREGNLALYNMEEYQKNRFNHLLKAIAPTCFALAIYYRLQLGSNPFQPITFSYLLNQTHELVFPLLGFLLLQISALVGIPFEDVTWFCILPEMLILAAGSLLMVSVLKNRVLLKFILFCAPVVLIPFTNVMTMLYCSNISSWVALCVNIVVAGLSYRFAAKRNE